MGAKGGRFSCAGPAHVNGYIGYSGARFLFAAWWKPAYKQKHCVSAYLRSAAARTSGRQLVFVSDYERRAMEEKSALLRASWRLIITGLGLMNSVLSRRIRMAVDFSISA